MRENREIIYDIWLSCALYGNVQKIRPLLETYESSKEIYENRDKILEELKFSKKLLASLNFTSIEEALQIYEKCDRLGIELLSYRDEKYPKRLLEIYDFPAVLYYTGKYFDIDKKLTLTVIGTRNPSNYALAATNFIVSGLAKVGSTIISGLALGIDARAHEIALENKTQTVAVLGGGLDIDYPKKNRELRNEIEKTGMVISEYPPGVRPVGWHFPIRNRILSGLSLGTLIMEGSRRSGTLHTAKHANEQGRDVYALPGDIFSPKADGTFSLIKDGAIPIREAMDVLENYLYAYPDLLANYEEIKEKSETSKKSTKVSSSFKENSKLDSKISDIDIEKPEPDLSGDEKKIYSALKKGQTHIDDLAKTLDMDVSALLTTLTELEMDGIIVSLAGRIYEIK